MPFAKPFYFHLSRLRQKDNFRLFALFVYIPKSQIFFFTILYYSQWAYTTFWLKRFGDFNFPHSKNVNKRDLCRKQKFQSDIYLFHCLWVECKCKAGITAAFQKVSFFKCQIKTNPFPSLFFPSLFLSDELGCHTLQFFTNFVNWYN